SVTAGHDAWAKQRPLLTAGHAGADEAQAALGAVLAAPAGVVEVRVASVDDDVASSSSGTSSSITLSTGAPAFTMTMILRGRSSAWTNSSMLSLPVKAPSFPKSARNFLVRSEVRLCTATGNPCLAMLRARLAPMTASPVTPMRLPPVIVAAPSLRSDHV